MKRPFAYIGFSALSSLVFAVGFGRGAAFCAAAVCFALFVVFLAAKLIFKKNTSAMILCSISACIALTSYILVITYYAAPIIEEYDGKTMTFTAVVTSDPYTSGGSTYFTVKTSEIDGEEKSLNIDVSTNYVRPVKYNDTVVCTADISASYSSGIGYESYNGARNIFLSAYISTYDGGEYTVCHSEDKSISDMFHSVRKKISQTFKAYLSSDAAAVCTSVLTGEKRGLPDDIYSNFKNLGISHMLVVSGLHLSIIASLLYALTKRAVKNRYASALIQLVGVFAFASMTGFGFSVIRAAIMISIVIVGRTLSLKSDPLNSLGLAAMILCIDPLNGGDIGLLWSFVSTLSIIVFSQRIDGFLNEMLGVKGKLAKGVIAVLSTSAAALAGSLPFLVFVTGSFSPYTLLVNILTVPFTGIIIVCGGLGVIFSALHLSFFVRLPIYIAGFVSKYIIFVSEKFSSLPFASIGTDKTYVYAWLIICAVGFIILRFADRKKKFTRCAVCISIALLISFYSVDCIMNYDKTTLSVLDVGDGLTVTLKHGGEAVVLCSYGEKYQYSTIEADISNKDIICVVDNTPDGEDYGYCAKIAAEADADSVWLNSDEKYDVDYCYMRYKGANTAKTGSSCTLGFWNSVSAKILTDNNNTWEYLDICGVSILICPPNGDVSLIPDYMRKAEIVIANEAPKNCDLLSGAYAVISNYGESCDEAAAVFSGMDFKTASTDGLGRIDFKFSPGGDYSAVQTYTGGVTKY